MAFTQATFAPVGNRSSDVPGTWSYKTSDDLLTVLAAKYFDDKRFQLEVGDYIYCVTSNSTGFVTYQGENQPSLSITQAGDANGPIVVLMSNSTAAQNPSALDTPLQVEFGGPVSGVGVDLDAQGTLTINEAGNYRLRAIFALGRTTTPGVAVVGIRLTVNGIQNTNPAFIRLNDGDFTIPEEFTITAQFQVGDTIKVEIVRDGAGINNGGLIPTTATTVPWGTSSSASITVARYV